MIRNSPIPSALKQTTEFMVWDFMKILQCKLESKTGQIYNNPLEYPKHQLLSRLPYILVVALAVSCVMFFQNLLSLIQKHHYE